jgi:hypothetical protein
MSVAGVAVRTMSQVPLNGLIIDGAVVVLSADTTNSVVTTAAELFEWVWPDAVPLTGRDVPVDLPIPIPPGVGAWRTRPRWRSSTRPPSRWLGARATQRHGMDSRPGWLEAILATLTWAWRGVGVPPLEIRSADAG